MSEKLVEQILSVNPALSREQLQTRLEEEKTKTGGLISGETLLRIIAAEFGLSVSHVASEAPMLSIGNLVPSLNNITVTGRVVAVFSPRVFNGKRSGKFASLLVADNSGVLRVVTWNDQTSLIESGKMTIGQVVRFSHGYTKEGRGGKVELHVSGKCKVEINPADVRQEDYPAIGRFTTEIRGISDSCRNDRVNVAGVVSRVSSVSVFERQDASSGKVMRFTLADETGEIPVVAWNEMVDQLEGKLRQGVGLQIVQGRVKKAMGEGLEIHIDAGAYVETLAMAERFTKIANLKEGLNSVSIEAEVATTPVAREVKTSKGELVRLASLQLKDETGKIWLSAWRTHAETASNLKQGDRVTIKNAYIKKGFSEHIEASTKDATSITRAA